MSISTFKYLGFLSIALGACGDDSGSSPDTSPQDTADIAEVSETDESDTLDPADTSGQPDTTGGTGITTDPAAVQTSSVDGYSRTVVNSSASTHWTHLLLTTGQLAVPAPAGTDAFHLGFQRYLVKLGDGVSVLTLDGVAFADLSRAPSDGQWHVDGATPETAAISDWWDYDGQNHVLSAKPDRLYVVKASERYFKVRFRDYYDANGSPGYITIDWAEVAAPAPASEVSTLTLPLSATAPTFASLKTHEVLASAPGSDSLAWDLAVKRVSVQSNGGTSGVGEGGAFLLGDGTLDDFVALPESATFTADAMWPVAGPPGSGEESRNAVLDGFYTYDPSTHAITVNPKVFAVKLADGSVVKLRFLAWSSTEVSFEYAPLEAAND